MNLKLCAYKRYGYMKKSVSVDYHPHLHVWGQLSGNWKLFVLKQQPYVSDA